MPAVVEPAFSQIGRKFREEMLQLRFFHFAQFETRKARRVEQAELSRVEQFGMPGRILSPQGLAADLSGLAGLKIQQHVGDAGFAHTGRTRQSRLCSL